MMAKWTRQERQKLIEIWGCENVQAQLQGCKRNQELYKTIATELQTGAGYESQQCREKIKKLKQEYKIKDKLNRTGEAGDKYLKAWVLFDQLDGILGHKPATRQPVVIDALVTDDEHVQRNSDSVRVTT